MRNLLEEIVRPVGASAETETDQRKYKDRGHIPEIDRSGIREPSCRQNEGDEDGKVTDQNEAFAHCVQTFCEQRVDQHHVEDQTDQNREVQREHRHDVSSSERDIEGVKSDQRGLEDLSPDIGFRLSSGDRMEMGEHRRGRNPEP